MSQIIGVESGISRETVHGKLVIKNAAQMLSSDEFVSARKLEFEMGCNIRLPTKWAIFLSKTTSDDWIGCYFKKLAYPQDCKEIKVSFKIYITKVNNEENYCLKSCDPAKNLVNLKDWGFAQVINREKLYELPLVDGTLTIQFEFTLYSNKTVQPKTEEEIKNDYELLFLRRFSKDMNKYRISDLPNVECATKIISSDGVEFKANRGILSVRSAVFQRMFKTQMSESETGIVHLDDLSSKVVDVLLEYIIAGTLQPAWKDEGVIDKLIYAAHKYELHLLLDFLENTVGTVCTTENAKGLAVLAERMGLKKAQTDLFYFIKGNATNLKDLLVFESGEL